MDVQRQIDAEPPLWVSLATWYSVVALLLLVALVAARFAEQMGWATWDGLSPRAQMRAEVGGAVISGVSAVLAGVALWPCPNDPASTPWPSRALW